MNAEPKASTNANDIHDLLAITVCPITHGPLQLLPDNNGVVSKQAMMRFPIIDGCLDLRLDAAQPLFDEQRSPSPQRKVNE